MPHAQTVLDRAFAARHVAIFGASTRPGKWGYVIPERLIEAGFQGRISLINPKGGRLFGHDFVGPEQATGADVAVVTTPAQAVPSVIRQCGVLEIPLAVVQASGFAEREKRELQDELVAAMVDTGVRVIGPNCVGIYVGSTHINTTIMPNFVPGSVSFITQSGGLAEHVAGRLRKLGAGYDVMLSLGNKIDINLVEAVSAIARRPESSVLLMYIERLDEGNEFLDLISSTSASLAVLAIVAGKTEAGRRATYSHTGSMIHRWDRTVGLLQDAGVVVMDDVSSAIAAAASAARSARADLRSVFVVSDGGGEAALMADALEGAGFELPQPDGNVAHLLGEILELESITNPLDLQDRAGPQVCAPILKVLLNSRQYDAVVMGGMLFGAYSQYWGQEAAAAEAAALNDLRSLVEKTSKPVIMQSAFAAEPSDVATGLRALGIPYLEWPGEVVEALKARASHLSVRTNAISLVRPAVVADPSLISSTERVVRALDSANICHGIGHLIDRDHLPVDEPGRWVLRLDGVPHKQRAQAIHVDLAGTQLRSAYDALAQVAETHRLPVRVRLSEFVDHRMELLITLWRSTAEGDGCLLGLGGAAVEDTRDVAVGRLPKSIQDVARVFGQTRVGRLLLYESPREASAFAEVTLRVARLFTEDFSDFDELELNPVAISNSGPCILDALPVIAADALAPYAMQRG